MAHSWHIRVGSWWFASVRRLPDLPFWFAGVRCFSLDDFPKLVTAAEFWPFEVGQYHWVVIAR
jgi:hypothetical protein